MQGGVGRASRVGVRSRFGYRLQYDAVFPQVERWWPAREVGTVLPVFWATWVVDGSLVRAWRRSAIPPLVPSIGSSCEDIRGSGLAVTVIIGINLPGAPKHRFHDHLRVAR
jgi:hypothetical protein